MIKGLVSIVMPAWNRQTYLAECIRSIQAQTYKNWELIIYDDGSTDGSKYLYDYYTKTDKRIKVIYGEHVGIAKARNTAFRATQGEYIAVFDSDDVMLPDRLKKNVQALSDVDFVTSYYWISDVHLTPDYSQVIKANHKVTFEDIKNNGAWPHFMITARRKCFEENPYREDFKKNDDSGLCWDWFKAGYTYKVIRKPLGIQRGHVGNTSKSKSGELEKVQAILDKEYAEWESCHSQPSKSQAS